MTTPSQKIFSQLERNSFLSALREIIFEKKQRSRQFNLSSLSRRSRVSTSLLSLILKGKRQVTLSTAEKLASGLGLRGRQRTYFLKLAKLQAARSQEEFFLIQNEILKMQKEKENVESALDIHQYRVLSNWYYSAIYALCDSRGLKNDSELIAARLKYRVDTKDIRQAIADMIECQLLEARGQMLIQTKKSIVAEDHIQRLALLRYHKSMLQLAGQALLDPSDKREFRGLTVGVPKHQLALIKQKIKDFFSELNSYLSDFENVDAVFQLNLQLFTLTKIDEPSDSEKPK